MHLISPKFLQTCQSKKAKILKSLFQDEDIFSIIMRQKDISFEEACAWIAKDVFNTELPIASESEVQMMRLAAKEMVNQMKIEPES